MRSISRRGFLKASGAALGGGGQPGWILKCKGWETDPNAYIYFITQAPVWEKICDLIGQPDWKTHPDYAKPPARLSRLNEIFARIEQWLPTRATYHLLPFVLAVALIVVALLYAGAQKNLGPSGVTVVIIRDDLAKKAKRLVRGHRWGRGLVQRAGSR